MNLPRQSVANLQATSRPARSHNARLRPDSPDAQPQLRSGSAHPRYLHTCWPLIVLAAWWGRLGHRRCARRHRRRRMHSGASRDRQPRGRAHWPRRKRNGPVRLGTGRQSAPGDVRRKLQRAVGLLETPLARRRSMHHWCRKALRDRIGEHSRSYPEGGRTRSGLCAAALGLELPGRATLPGTTDVPGRLAG